MLSIMFMFRGWWRAGAGGLLRDQVPVSDVSDDFFPVTGKNFNNFYRVGISYHNNTVRGRVPTIVMGHLWGAGEKREGGGESRLSLSLSLPFASSAAGRDVRGSRGNGPSAVRREVRVVVNPNHRASTSMGRRGGFFGKIYRRWCGVLSPAPFTFKRSS